MHNGLQGSPLQEELSRARQRRQRGVRPCKMKVPQTRHRNPRPRTLWRTSDRYLDPGGHSGQASKPSRQKVLEYPTTRKTNLPPSTAKLNVHCSKQGQSKFNANQRMFPVLMTPSKNWAFT